MIKGTCCTDGLIRYNQLRKLSPRGLVKAVPLSCSAYKPYGGLCGLCCPFGKAPLKASDLKVLPKLQAGEEVTIEYSQINLDEAADTEGLSTLGAIEKKIDTLNAKVTQALAGRRIM